MPSLCDCTAAPNGVPYQFKVTLSGTTNGTCTTCSSLNGDYILTYQGSCVWNVNLTPAICGWRQITLSVSQNADGILKLQVQLPGFIPTDTYAIASVDSSLADTYTLSLSTSSGVCTLPSTITVRALAGAGVITTHDEVGYAVILSDEGMPDCFPWPPHAHGQRQHRKLYRSLGIFREQQLIATDASEIVDVSRFGHADRGMNEEIGFDGFRGPEGQFHMGTVHRVAGLECHDPSPAHAGEFRAQLRRGEAENAEIIMGRQLQAF